MYNEEDPDHRVEDREDSGMYVNEGSAMSAMLQEVETLITCANQ